MPTTEDPAQLAIRVALCDDSIGFRTLVRSWIAAEDGLELVGAAEDGAGVRRLVAQAGPDVLVLDLVLPDVDDAQTLVAELRALHPGLRIVLMSSLEARALARAAAAAGVDAHLHKATTAPALCDLLRQVARRPPEHAGA